MIFMAWCVRYIRSPVSRAAQLQSGYVLQEEGLCGLIPRFETEGNPYNDTKKCSDAISYCDHCRDTQIPNAANEYLHKNLI